MRQERKWRAPWELGSPRDRESGGWGIFCLNNIFLNRNSKNSARFSEIRNLARRRHGPCRNLGFGTGQAETSCFGTGQAETRLICMLARVSRNGWADSVFRLWPCRKLYFNLFLVFPYFDRTGYFAAIFLVKAD